MINSGIDFFWVHLYISGLFLIIGLYLIFNPPKEINTSTGLNLPSSIAKLNMDTWTEFHKYSGKMMAICGSICFLLSLLLKYLIQFSELSSDKIEGLNLVLLITLSKCMILTMLVSTENHMNKTFDKKGNRKEK